MMSHCRRSAQRRYQGRLSWAAGVATWRVESVCWRWVLPDAVLAVDGGLKATLHLALDAPGYLLLLLMEVAGDGALLLADGAAHGVGGGGDGLGDEFLLVGATVLLRTGLVDALAEKGIHALMPR